MDPNLADLFAQTMEAAVKRLAKQVNADMFGDGNVDYTVREEES